MPSKRTNKDLRTRVFYAIQKYDIELAEQFAIRCPIVESMIELNNFFHMLLSQYSVDTHSLRMCLDDTMTIDDWLHHFNMTVLPFILKNRLPTNTPAVSMSPYTHEVHCR